MTMSAPPTSSSYHSISSDLTPLLPDQQQQQSQQQQQQRRRPRNMTNTRRRSLQNPHLTKREYILTGILVAVIVICSIVAGVKDRKRKCAEEHRNPHIPAPTPPGQEPGEGKPETEYTSICATNACWEHSRALRTSMNTSVNPCEDFEQYACGQWKQRNVIPEDKAALSSFGILSEKNQEIIQGLLTNSKTKKKNMTDDESKLFDKVQNVFDACMNTTTLDIKNVQDIFESIRGADGLTAKLIYVRQIGSSAIVSSGVTVDPHNPKQHIIQASQPALTLSQALFNETEEITKYTAIVDQVMKAVAGFSNDTVTAVQLVTFETELAKIEVAPEVEQDPMKNSNAIKMADLQTKLPSINMTQFLNITSETSIIEAVPTYFSALNAVIANTSAEVINAYLCWRTLLNYQGAVPIDIADMLLPLLTLTTGQSEYQSRMKRCSAHLDNAMGYAIGHFFAIATKFDVEAKKKAEAMFESIRDQFRIILSESFLDAPTKVKAQEKLNAMTPRMGYPTFVSSAAELLTKYNDLNVTADNYHKNILNAEIWSEEQNWAKLSVPVNSSDNADWDMTPATVNAYYDPTTNVIAFPAGILQPPFFHADLPQYINLGGVGLVVGHELSHGFDNNGRHYDKDGALVDWWTEESTNQFNTLSECFVQMFNKFVIPTATVGNLIVNGRLTLGENLADSGGMSASFAALKKSDSLKIALPELTHMTPAQLYYLSFAQVWCGTMRDQALKRQVDTNEHSPGAIRIKGTVMNNADFGEVFKCKAPEQPMNPQGKCKVW